MRKLSYPLIRLVCPEQPSDPKAVVTVVRTRLIDIPSFTLADLNIAGLPYFKTRSEGELAGHGFYLDGMFEWILVQDFTGHAVLVPLKRVC